MHQQITRFDYAIMVDRHWTDYVAMWLKHGFD